MDSKPENRAWKQLDDHETRIRCLEISDAQMAEQIKDLIKELASLTGWIKLLIGSIFTTLVGFIIWYIQTLPR